MPKMASTRRRSSVSTSESVGNPSLRELLHRPPAQIENNKKRKFLLAAEVKQLLTQERISGWIKNHPLHRDSDTYTHDQGLIDSIINSSRLLFAVLVLAKLEHLTSALLSNGQTDDSLPEIDCSSLDLSPDEQLRLDEHRHTIVLRKSKHLRLSPGTGLPYMEREFTDKNRSDGLIYRAVIADGHLEGYDKVEYCLCIQRHTNC